MCILVDQAPPNAFNIIVWALHWRHHLCFGIQKGWANGSSYTRNLYKQKRNTATCSSQDAPIANIFSLQIQVLRTFHAARKHWRSCVGRLSSSNHSGPFAMASLSKDWMVAFLHLPPEFFHVAADWNHVNSNYIYPLTRITVQMLTNFMGKLQTPVTDLAIRISNGYELEKNSGWMDCTANPWISLNHFPILHAGSLNIYGYMPGPNMSTTQGFQQTRGQVNRLAFRNTSSRHNSLLQATSSLIVCPGHLLFLPTTGIAGNCALVCGKTACVKGEVWTLKNLGTTVLIGAGHVKTFDGLVPLLLVVEWMRLLLVCNINFHLNSQLTELFPNNNHHPGSNQKKTRHVVFFFKQNFRTACVSSSNCVSNGIQSPTRWPGGVGRKPPPGLAVSTSPHQPAAVDGKAPWSSQSSRNLSTGPCLARNMKLCVYFFGVKSC